MEAVPGSGEAKARIGRRVGASIAIFSRTLSDNGGPHRRRSPASSARRLIETGCPVRILQGVADPDVPWRHAVELVSRLAQDDVVLSLIKDGDHRLSRPEDIERLIGAVSEFCKNGSG